MSNPIIDPIVKQLAHAVKGNDKNQVSVLSTAIKRTIDIYNYQIRRSSKRKKKEILLASRYPHTQFLESGQTTTNREWTIEPGNERVGSGKFGTITAVFAGDDHDYVAKHITYKQAARTWEVHTAGEFKDFVVNEVELQIMAADAGIALPIYDAWFTHTTDEKTNTRYIQSATIVMKRADMTVQEVVAKRYKDADFISGLKSACTLLVNKLHALKINHNDIYLDNIMYIKKDGQLVLIDFGIAEYTPAKPQEMFASSSDLVGIETIDTYVRCYKEGAISTNDSFEEIQQIIKKRYTQHQTLPH